MGINQRLIIVYCIIIGFIAPCYSQSTFVWKMHKSDGFTKMFELNNSYYFIGNRIKSNNGNTSDSAVIMKWSCNGDSIDRVFKSDSINKNVMFHLIIPHSNNGVITIGTLGKKTNFYDTSDLWLIGFDSLLNVLWTDTIPFQRRGIHPVAVKKMLNNNWLIALKTDNDAWFSEAPHPILVEFTENGVIKHIVPHDTMAIISDIAIHPVTGNIYCLGDYLVNPYGAQSRSYLKIMDSNYNWIADKPIFPNNSTVSLWDPFLGIWQNNDTLLLACMKIYWNIQPQDMDVCLYYMKETDSILPLKESCFRRYGTKDYTMYNGLCENAQNQFLLIGELDDLYWEKTWFGCFDKQLNLLYHRIITSSELRYLPNYIYPTSDSGFFLFNSEIHTWSNIYQQIIKFDKYGNCPALDIANSPVKIERHLLYPNPGKDYFKLVLSPEMLDNKPCILELYNTNGSLQQQWTFQGYETEMITRNLPDGLYFYRVLQNNQLIASGKWLKQ